MATTMEADPHAARGSAHDASRVKTLLEFVKIEHSLFALPFILAGFIVGLVTMHAPLVASAANARLFALVVVAAVGARTCAMTLNRIVDRAIDAANPRTAARALPAGVLSLRAAWILAIASTSVLVAASLALNPLCAALSPVLVALFFAYPYAKRVTWLCHFVLGLAFFCAPGGGFLAVTGAFLPATGTLVDLLPIALLGLAAALWVSGFDVIYALLDVPFDREHGLFSLPARFGERVGLTTAAALHTVMLAALVLFGLSLALRSPFWVALVAVAALLAYEHAIAKPDDPGAINRAFFNVNAGIGWIVLAGLVASLAAH
ncbi:MAG: 4-hydroxybenzoate octaprenyltransferase [Thermoplasmatota archaeon]